MTSNFLIFAGCQTNLPGSTDDKDTVDEYIVSSIGKRGDPLAKEVRSHEFEGMCKQITKLRLKHGLSLTKLANFAGISKGC